ncbi:hypothetical protein [Fodinibius sp.]|uniref:hypothetical protein n=1 Tax=Fodinibius sp. TaxID=1872440 RepID=UPI00356B1AC9
MIKKTVLLVLFLFLVARAGYTQEGSYERFTVDANSALSVLHNAFTDNWESPPSLHLGTRVTYHAGNLEAGLRYTDYNVTNPDYGEADFSSYFIYIGWEYPFTLYRGLTLAPGLRFGNNFMSFDNPKVYPPTSGWAAYPFDPHESEFAYELIARLEYSPGTSPWRIHSGFAFNRTLTYHPLSVGLISFGISRSFATPSWLKNFLK